MGGGIIIDTQLDAAGFECNSDKLINAVNQVSDSIKQLTLHQLDIDLETYSSVPLKEAGAQKYIESPDFEILLFAYSVDYSEPVTVDVASGEKVPDWLIAALHDPQYLKIAHNAPFEFGCLSKVYGEMVPSQWRCSMFHALYCGYPPSLEAVGAALGMAEDKKKMLAGKNLIRYFCTPCSPTKANGMRTRNYPHHDPEKWTTFKTYNRQDVVTEMEVERRLSNIPVPAWLQKQWETDLIINRRGVAVDMTLANGALAVGDVVREELTAEAARISGLRNPNSVKQLAVWLNNEIDDEEITDMKKETVSRLLGKDNNSDEVQRMLEIRQELGKTSTKKYNKIEAGVCANGRIHGLLQFYGANRTGRWAGRLVQVQNLPRTYTEPLGFARELVKAQNTNALHTVYGSVPDTLSQLIRTALTAAPGNVLIDADFSAIEARVISWLAGQEWRLEVFRSHGKIYEASASQMFGVPLEKIKKGNPEYELRARGKVAELALGYQGGVGAMRRMDSGHKLDSLSDAEMQEIVDKWRNTNSKIRQLWYDMNDAAIQVISSGGCVCVRGLWLAREYDYSQGTYCMSILLPSGRKLYYVSPSIGQNKWGNPSITYHGVNDKNKWGVIETYGGKLVENCVQAIARDCLAAAIDRLEAKRFPVVFHVHDEVIIDMPPFGTEDAMLDTVISIMSEPIPWAKDLPLGADGWVGNFYRKD